MGARARACGVKYVRMSVHMPAKALCGTKLTQGECWAAAPQAECVIQAGAPRAQGCRLHRPREPQDATGAMRRGRDEGETACT